MKKFLIGIDAGTSMVKSVVFDEEGNELAVARQRTAVLNPRPNWDEQDMNEVWEAVVKTIKEAVTKSGVTGKEICAIGVTGQGDGCWLIDEKGNPVRPAILWSDGRAGDLIARWQAEGISDKAYKILGSVLFSGVQAAIIKWLDENEPESLTRSRWALYCKDWLKYKLTGEITTDETDGCVPHFDIAKRRYSEELLKMYGTLKYEYLLPTVKAPLENHAPLSQKAASLLGLPSGIPVIGGPFDVIATATGVGAIHSGDACSIIGTTCFNEVVMDGPYIEPMNVGFTMCHGFPGLWVRAMGVMMGTPNLDWILAQVGRPYEEEAAERGMSFYDVIEEHVKKLEIGAGGVVYHPYLSASGERAPFVKPTARAQFFGITATHNRDNLVRAVYEGVGFSMMDCYQYIPMKVNRVRISGGGAQSDFWCQLLSDMTGLPLEVPKGSEFGAKGTALVAGIAVGLYKDIEDAVNKTVQLERQYQPDVEKTKRARAFYTLYRRLYEHVWDDWDLLQDILTQRF